MRCQLQMKHGASNSGQNFDGLNAAAKFWEPQQRKAKRPWESVGALRKHAGGMFLASDLGGYAAVAATSPYTGEALGVRA